MGCLPFRHPSISVGLFLACRKAKQFVFLHSLDWRKIRVSYRLINVSSEIVQS
jgi:hypothetical protein